MLDYTFGNDEIAQRVVTDDGQGNTTDATYVFGHDGHGSVRVIYDLAATAANIAQVFTFAPYGEMIALHDATAQSIDVTNRLSSLGYSGEHFDAKAQQQYLRARFYDPANGRFNRLDPYSGNMQDPQSLNKYAYVHGDPVQGMDPTGQFNVPAMAVRIGIGAALGATGAVGFNAVRNHAIGMPLFHGWKQAFLAGAIIGGAGVVSPWIYYLVSGLAVADSLAVAADTIQDPNASWDQVVASISLVAISGLAMGGSRAYAGRFGKISEGLGGSRWYSIRIPSRPLGTKLVVPRGPNEAYFEYLAWSTQRPAAGILGQLRPGETPTPSEHQVSAGGLFEIPVSLFGKRFLYNIDETGVGAIARNPDVGTPGRTGHPFFGNTSKAAGEVIFQGRRVIINDSTGRGRRDLTLAQRFFESLGYEVETRSWRGAEFGDNYGHSGMVPINPPGT